MMTSQKLHLFFLINGSFFRKDDQMEKETPKLNRNDQSELESSQKAGK